MYTPWYPGQTHTNLDPLSTNYFTGGQMGYMPNAQYLTDPSYGAFRTPMPMQPHPTNYNYPGLFQSLMTSWRGDDSNKVLRFIGETFAHSPIGANQLQYQAEATRRIQDATGAFQGTALDLGIQSLFTAVGTGLGAASPIPGGAFIGGAIGGMLAPSVGGMVTDRKRTARQLQLLTSPLITSGRDVNKATGQGLNLSAAGDLTSFLNKEAAGDYFFKLDDYKKFTSLAAKSGMFDYANSTDQYKDTIKKVRKDIMTLMDIFETADPEDVFKQLQRLQASGSGQSESTGIASKERMYSTMMGIGHQQMISTYGQSGALAYNQMGRTGYLGELSNIANAANITMAKRLGLISESELNRMGGVGGMSDRMTHEVQGQAFGDVMKMIGPHIWSGDMEGSIDKKKLDQIRAGNYSLEELQKSMASMPQSQIRRYDLIKDKLFHNIESAVGENGTLQSVYDMAVKVADRTSVRYEDEQTKAMEGMRMMRVSAPLARQVMEYVNNPEMRSATKENEEKEYEKRLASINKKYEEQEHLWAKMTVKFKEAFNMFEEMSLKGLSIRAKWLEDQRKENRANGKDTPLVFDQGKGSGFTKGTPDDTKKQGAKERLEQQGIIAPPPPDTNTYNAIPGGGIDEMFTPRKGGIPAPHVPVDTNKPDWQQERYQKVQKVREAQKYPSKFVYKGGKAYDGKYDDIISEMAKKYNVPENAVKSILLRESNFTPEAISKPNKDGSRDYGIGQINDKNFDALEKQGIPIKSKWSDPKVGIEASVKIFAEGWHKTGGDIGKSAAMYNGGPRMQDKSKWGAAVTDYANDVTNSYNSLQQSNVQMPKKAQEYAKSAGATDKSTNTTNWYDFSHQWRMWTPEILEKVKDYTEQDDYSKVHNAVDAPTSTRVRGRDEFNSEINKYGLNTEHILKPLQGTTDITKFNPKDLEAQILKQMKISHLNVYNEELSVEKEKEYKESASKLANNPNVLSHILYGAVKNNSALRKSYVTWGNKVNEAYYYIRNQIHADELNETDKIMKDIAPGVEGATGDDLNSVTDKNLELLKAYQVTSVGSKVNAEKENGRNADEYSERLRALLPSDFKLEDNGTIDLDKYREYLKTKGYDQSAIDKVIDFGKAKKETFKGGADVDSFITKSNDAYKRKLSESYYSSVMGFEDFMRDSGVTPEMLKDPNKMKQFVENNPDNDIAKSMLQGMSDGALDVPKFLNQHSQKLRDFTSAMASPDHPSPEAHQKREDRIKALRDELAQELKKLNQTLQSLDKNMHTGTIQKKEEHGQKVAQGVIKNVTTTKGPNAFGGL